MLMLECRLPEEPNENSNQGEERLPCARSVVASALSASKRPGRTSQTGTAERDRFHLGREDPYARWSQAERHRVSAERPEGAAPGYFRVDPLHQRQLPRPGVLLRPAWVCVCPGRRTRTGKFRRAFRSLPARAA